MNLRNRLSLFLCLSGICAAVAYAQDSPPSNPEGAPRQEGRRAGREGQMNGERPLFGKITAMSDGTIELTRPDGPVVTVKVTDQTQFRKDRQPAKSADFKVGDLVMVRGDENADHTVTAKLIGGRTGNMADGSGGGPSGRGGGMMITGTLGKDYVLGQVKSIDPPRLTVLRTDNVTQTLELNEETTLRRGRESITMADLQVGDHLVAHGAVQNNVFVPKGVMLMTAEQWERMQNFMGQMNGAKPADSATPVAKP